MSELLTQVKTRDATASKNAPDWNVSIPDWNIDVPSLVRYTDLHHTGQAQRGEEREQQPDAPHVSLVLRGAMGGPTPHTSHQDGYFVYIKYFLHLCRYKTHWNYKINGKKLVLK